MNIYIFNHYGEPPTTGKNIRHYQFAKNLNDRGHKTTLFTASTIHTTDINYIKGGSKNYIIKEFGNVPFVFIKTCNYFGNGKKRILNIIQYAFRILYVSKNINFEKPDVVFASSAHPLTWLSAYRISRRYNAKFIAETRDLWPETLVAMGKLKRNGIIAKTLYKIEKNIYLNADKLIFTFPGGKDYVAGIEGIDTQKVEYINNGVDLYKFNTDKETNIICDEDLDDMNSFKILYTGAMGIANSLNYLLESAKILKDSGYSNIKFILYGDGYQKKELEAYAMENQLTNVIFKGKVDRKYIPYILSKSDLNIFNGKALSVYRYGLSLNKMFEYFASGKPTLSNIECGYDLLEEYKCGITAKGGSSEALAEGILNFYNMDKEEYNQYCHNALKASLDFDFKILTDKLEKILFDVRKGENNADTID